MCVHSHINCTIKTCKGAKKTPKKKVATQAERILVDRTDLGPTKNLPEETLLWQRWGGGKKKPKKPMRLRGGGLVPKNRRGREERNPSRNAKIGIAIRHRSAKKGETKATITNSGGKNAMPCGLWDDRPNRIWEGSPPRGGKKKKELREEGGDLREGKTGTGKEKSQQEWS